MMKRWTALALCVIVIMTLGAVIAQEDEGEEPLEFVGDGACENCHEAMHESFEASSHMQSLNSTRRNTDAVVADFTQGEELRTVQFPDEEVTRPFTLDDLAYVVGSGRYVQRFLYRVDRGDHLVFPAEWNIATQEWQPFELAESWPDPAYDWEDNCAGCHTTGLNAERDDWEDDGVTCEACHGPGSAHNKLAARADDPATDEQLQDIRANIATAPDAQICGQCHSRGNTPEGLPYPMGYLPGHDLLDPEVFTLVDADEAGAWWTAGHDMQPTAQLNQWLRSTHAEVALKDVKESDYAEDSCLGCHSAEDDATLETVSFGVTCQVCHDPHMASEGEEGTLTHSLREEPYPLCIQCHNATTADGLLRIGEEIHHPVQEMFEGQEFIDQVTGIPSQHFTNEVMCADCHMPASPGGEESCAAGNHSMQTICPTEGGIDSCSTCHSDLGSDYLRQFMENTQTRTSERLDAAREALANNGEADVWMHDVINFIENDGSLGMHNYAYADALLYAVEVQLGVRQAAGPEPFVQLTVTDPEACADCHRDEFNLWHTSPHAEASLNDIFVQEFSAQGRPSYCMRCHASGYNPETEEYVFEGVICSNCHVPAGDGEHPPAPIDIGDASEICGRCHSGAHAPTYDEWLASPHNNIEVGCVDCHTPHNNGLVLGSVNETCGDCHPNTLVDEVHMGVDESGEQMDCVDCHMARQVDESGVHVIATGHTMFIDPSICAECHGNVHMLSDIDMGITAPEPAGETEIESLQHQVDQLQSERNQVWSSGVTGGAFGMLVVAVVVGLVWSRRRRP